MIYGVSDCPWCLKAQALCMEKNVQYVWINMDWSEHYREMTKIKWNWKTYPIITNAFMDKLSPEEILVGGFEDLKKRTSLRRGIA
jgi:glutaredoxin